MKMTVIIPCYNEAENIPLLLKRFNEVIKGQELTVLLVNNGSTDNSAEVISTLIPEYPFAQTIHVPINKGYGYGILQGLQIAEGDYVGWTHADMQTDPVDVVKAYGIARKYSGEKLFIKGKRIGRPVFDQFFTKGMSLFESVYFRMPIFDINAQPNIFPRSFFESWENAPYDFSLDLFAYYEAKRSGLMVRRFAVRFPERLHGQSKWNHGDLQSKWKFIKRTIKFSIALKHGVWKKNE